MSHDFIDGKTALAKGEHLELACRAMIDAMDNLGVEWDAVGGLTMGADQFSHVTAVLARKKWFVVRKEVKGRGTNKRIEGEDVGPACYWLTTWSLPVDPFKRHTASSGRRARPRRGSRNPGGSG